MRSDKSGHSIVIIICDIYFVVFDPNLGNYIFLNGR